ncbi:DNA-formamidopyrimidine glycosylase family protein [Haloechinothrix sp. LS1_15]|uniref:Fpg/Nei family DNA glycosylase n=1 Tax=Haloechinothrix sp. LS1_15 TaxID=2652248 RepID=UPI0029478E1E|nr:zinc finger domain-containing protein [Haloechinothrix sp. LS1_15]MDV6012002.1 Fpg/Nei family DNA glycosylase [Haloechinothrix sp. LS1_15]
MPEGHTLHRLAELHHRRYARHRVAVSSPQGRFATGASVVDGAVFTGAEAYGKHLFHHYGAAGTVHIHLGLYGKFAEAPLPVEPPVGKVRMRVVGPTHWTDLRGPTRCELITEPERDVLVSKLGPDPLRPDADPERAWDRVSRSRAPLAVLLMDQSVIAGVGNVYRAELLFRHGIDPATPGERLDRDTWQALWTDLAELMAYGVTTGRIDTVRDEHAPEATGRAPRRDRHGGEVYVYRRAGQPCYVCGTAIALRALASRKLYWCPRCQACHAGPADQVG